VIGLGRRVRETFYNPGGIHDELIEGQYVAVGTTVSRVLERGARVLDFGAGECDIAALLAMMGYRCSACDDLSDPAHLRGGLRGRIARFAEDAGVDFTLLEGDGLPYQPASFDMVMMHHVLEHLHDSPRGLLNALTALVRPRGHVFITVPNAGNARKRLDLLRGRTNLPEYERLFWSEGPWRGHVREYVRGDLEALARLMGLEIEELRTFHSMLHVVPRRLRPLYRAATALAPGWRDTWLLLARRPAGWSPVGPPADGAPAEPAGATAAAVGG
jgi:SAM-dependent methyltransferase